MRIRVLAISLVLIAFVQLAGAEDSQSTPPPETPSSINERFIDPDNDPSEWVKRWEAESREIYVARHQIVEAAKLKPGMRIADVGAGTGLFVELFASAVGNEGKVFALDISPKFVEFVAERSKTAGLDQVEARLSKSDSAELAEASVDVVFLCDTYHHFDHPAKMLRSIHGALRPGGKLVIVDFERIEGKSRKWVLGHVRAGKEAVVKEIAAEGFTLVEEPRIDELRENYCLVFSKNPKDARK